MVSVAIRRTVIGDAMRSGRQSSECQGHGAAFAAYSFGERPRRVPHRTLAGRVLGCLDAQKEPAGCRGVGRGVCVGGRRAAAVEPDPARPRPRVVGEPLGVVRLRRPLASESAIRARCPLGAGGSADRRAAVAAVPPRDQLPRPGADSRAPDHPCALRQLLLVAVRRGPCAAARPAGDRLGPRTTSPGGDIGVADPGAVELSRLAGIARYARGLDRGDRVGACTAHRLLRRPAVGAGAVDCLLAGVRLDLAVGAGGEAAAALAQAVAGG